MLTAFHLKKLMQVNSFIVAFRNQPFPIITQCFGHSGAFVGQSVVGHLICCAE